MPYGSCIEHDAQIDSCLKRRKTMNQLTRFDTSALNRALVGFDRIFDNFESRFANQINNNYPPYNVVRFSENNYGITLAIAGFKKEEVSVEVDQDQLVIRGEKQEHEDENSEYLHRGLALRNFERRFTIAEHVEVVKAEIKHGLLTIGLERKIPEALLPRKIEVKQLTD